MSLKKKSNGKVFVGLSGGVDSAVSAALLQKEGYEVTGVFIRIALPGYPCSAGEDKIEAQRAAAHLRIPFIEVDLSKEYEQEVFRTTLDEFSRGTTPNPDTLCNQKIKFGHFWEFAKSRGAEYIATGHYAQIKNGELFEGVDEEKDQSYFLWMVPEEVLRYTLFPVGHLKKSEVRTRAETLGLPNATRKDSQGLCFLGDTSIQNMLRKELSPQPGQAFDEEDVVVGSHNGAMLYTLGQRHGFALFSHTPTTPPHFVVAKDAAHNSITVSTSRVPRHAKKTEIILSDTNWIGKVVSGIYAARFRYRAALIPAHVAVETNTVVLEEAQYVPEGQSLVLYRGKRCLGGGIIERALLL